MSEVAGGSTQHSSIVTAQSHQSIKKQHETKKNNCAKLAVTGQGLHPTGPSTILQGTVRGTLDRGAIQNGQALSLAAVCYLIWTGWWKGPISSYS